MARGMALDWQPRPHAHPLRLEADALAEKGAHTVVIHTVQQTPRIYQGGCLDCGWLGDMSKPNQYRQMLDHARATLPRR
jgi:hypothetical protein